MMGTTEDRMGIQKLIFQKSYPGQGGLAFPEDGVESVAVEKLLPGIALRDRPPSLPEVAEPQIVRHYTRLSHLNYAVDTGFYPLGSCTMKYNPKLNDELAGLSGFSALHPYQDPKDVQGALQVMWELEQALLAITGMERMSLQPAAGAHGELAGILMIRAYHLDHGGEYRDTVIVPDSAHGTNLATAAMAGFSVQEISSSERGTIDPAILAAALSARTPARRLPYPVRQHLHARVRGLHRPPEEAGRDDQGRRQEVVGLPNARSHRLFPPDSPGSHDDRTDGERGSRYTR